MRRWPARRLDRSPLRSWPSGTRLIRPERRRDSNRPWLSRSALVGITKRPWTTLSRWKRRALTGRSRNWTGTGSRRDPLRRARPRTLAWWRTPFLGSCEPGFRNRISPLPARSLLRRHPLRNRERSLRCLRRFRNLADRTAETRRFCTGFHVYLTWPRKNGRVRTAFT